MSRRAVVVGLLAVCSGCAVTRAEVKTRVEHRMAGGFVYPQPIERVWPEAIKMIRDAGYTDLEESSDVFEAVSDWKDDSTGGVARIFTRYLVQGERIESDRCTLHLFRHEVTITPDVEHAGWGMKAMLIRTGQIVHPLQYDHNADRRLSGTDEAAGRDLGMEWQLLRRLEPRLAAIFEIEANRRGGRPATGPQFAVSGASP